MPVRRRCWAARRRTPAKVHAHACIPQDIPVNIYRLSHASAEEQAPPAFPPAPSNITEVPEGDAPKVPREHGAEQRDGRSAHARLISAGGRRRRGAAARDVAPVPEQRGQEVRLHVRAAVLMVRPCQAHRARRGWRELHHHCLQIPLSLEFYHGSMEIACASCMGARDFAWRRQSSQTIACDDGPATRQDLCLRGSVRGAPTPGPSRSPSPATAPSPPPWRRA